MVLVIGAVLFLDLSEGTERNLITTRVFDSLVGGTLLQEIVITPSGAVGTGDGSLTKIDFSSGFARTDAIRRLEFFSFAGFGANIPGYAIDNLSFAPTTVPEPASITLFATSLAGLGWFAWRRRRREAVAA